MSVMAVAPLTYGAGIYSSQELTIYKELYLFLLRSCALLGTMVAVSKI